LATPTTSIYTLSLHDALPICRAQVDLGRGGHASNAVHGRAGHLPKHTHQNLVGHEPEVLGRHQHPPGNSPVRPAADAQEPDRRVDRKSTRLNSSHVKISYAVF